MESVKNGFLKVMGIINKAEIWLSGFVLAALILVTVAGTLTRYFLRMPFIWMEEFQLASMLWIVFLAGSAAFHAKAHVAIEMVVDVFPVKVQHIINILIGVIVILVLMFVIQSSMAYIDVFSRSGRTTPILKLPYTGIYGIVPVTCILMIFEYFHGLLDTGSN